MPKVIPAVFAVLLLVPTGCGPVLDARRATLCRRAVPALAPAGTTVGSVSVGRSATAGSVRVDYSLAGSPAAAAKAHWIVCSFGPDAGLEAVTTESGPLGGASLYLLKHYYLDTPDAAAADLGSR